ncbi:MAG: hypothetical protein BEN19_04285 [Epulopiscium sp. Nuni2H_MBin003]|nr:MAG: hypothetical protein BEN19_04285 [Epulopiscium sp. Nuni2H_MBin003]
MNLKEGYFDVRDGISIFYLSDIPSNCKGIVIIAHGFMEHSGRYVEFANKLVQNGYGVCIIDHRGNGRSKGEHGDVDDFFLFVSDIKELVNSLQKYNVPIYTYGHSMGGLITFLYGLKYEKDLAGQIFSSPALAKPTFLSHVPKKVYKAMGTNFPMLKIKRGGVNVAVKGDKFKKLFKEDTLVNKYSTARFFDEFLRKGVNYAVNNAFKYNLPSFFLLASEDYVIPREDSEKVIDSLTAINKTKKVYKDCMHDLLHDDNMNVEQVTKDVIEWLNGRKKSIIV